MKPKSIEPILRHNLLKLATEYSRLSNLTLRTIGKKMHGDGPFFEKLRDRGGSFTARKYDEVIAQFVKQWPEDQPFPALRDIEHTLRIDGFPKPTTDGKTRGSAVA